MDGQNLHGSTGRHAQVEVILVNLSQTLKHFVQREKTAILSFVGE